MGEGEARTQAARVSGHTCAAEDAASSRPARPGGSRVIVNRVLRPRIAVITFPGSQDDRDALWALGAVRAGAIARFSPAMEAVAAYAAEGGLVLGICNGFQVLCEAGLLPGVLRPNVSLEFVCKDVPLRARAAARRPREAR